jgi:hypothetical protein
MREYKRTHARKKYPKVLPTVVGIDGEGITVNGKHLYTYIAAWTSEECIATEENPEGLSPTQVFEFLLRVKRSVPHSLLVGFSLGYDYSKWFEGLPVWAITKLSRPESRRGKRTPNPVRVSGYCINYLRGRMTVAKLIPGAHEKWCEGECTGCKSGDNAVVWDVWGFFQGSFVDACQKWGVINQAEYDYLRSMKLKRPTFSVESWGEVKDYCGVECQRLARLVTELRAAHLAAEIPLSSYYGAGSTASSLLKRMGVKACMPREELHPELKYAVACAFFGGRFEIGRFGPVREECHSYDIASAYPYHLTGMPCLACGKWRKVKRIPAGAKYGFVRYQLPPSSLVKVKDGVSEVPWGPFPLRLPDGNITYPVTSGGGWVSLDEYRAGEEFWPNVWCKEAWIYETDCEHQPFKGLADVYCLRLEWGKESRGIVVKLGPNSCYGKIAQSLGKNPPFQCFPWAAWDTGNTRAQLLRLIAQAPLAVTNSATDGIISTVQLDPGEPRDTGTAEAAKRYGKQPLGAWEHKLVPGGMHLIRPGVAFPLSSELEAEVKGRGIGKAVLKNHRAMVLDMWEKHGPKPFEVEGDIFHGMKSATAVTSAGYVKRENYGQWSRRKTQVSYMPEPKRPFALTEDGRLCTWAYGKDVESQPYPRIMGVYGDTPAHVLALRREKELQAEQPDREPTLEEL